MLLSVVVFFCVFSLVFTPIHTMSKERTFIAVKPDGVQRGLTGEIIKRFETKGFKMVAMKFMQASEEHLKKHYADLSDKPFFTGLVKYMASGPLVAMVWEGTGIVKTARQMMGETKPADSKPGTIRGDFCIEVGRNIIHGSDSMESANKEISLWFKPEELVSWTQAAHDWIYEFLDQLGDVGSDSGLASLNQFLKDKSYIQGYIPSKNDLIVFVHTNPAVNKHMYPHVFRWHKHIRFICTELEVSLGLPGFTARQKIAFKKVAEKQNATIKSQNKEMVSGGENMAPECERVLPVNKKVVSKSEVAVPDIQEEIQNGKAVSEKERRNITDEKDLDDKVVVASEFSNTYAILLEIKPKDEETDMAELEDLVRDVTLDGLKWGASQLTPIAYGVHKLSIICTVEDDKSSIQDVLQKLIKFEDYVKDVNIAAFNKV